MANLETIIFILAILIGLSAVADKIKLPYPILLVGAGLVIGFVPFLPNLALEPDIVFLLFLPPLLYDAAAKTSWQEFTTSIRTISTLAVTLVFFTATAVAIVAHYLVPGFSWPLAFVLGAIVSPPDAVAATSIIKGLGLNKRVIAILEGESLLNDASALIAYRYAVAAVTTGSFVLWKAGLQFLLVAGGGLVIGIVTGLLFVAIFRRIDDTLVETSLTFLAPFVAYLTAEHVHTSGVLAVVSTGLVITRKTPEVLSYQSRIHTRAVWDTLIFIMNGLVFILIGLQLPGIVADLHAYTTWELIYYSLAISAITIIVRILWVFLSAYYPSLLRPAAKPKDVSRGEPDEEVNWKNVLIVAWTGTRGVVSLATALALPLTLPQGGVFPNRPLILFLAFSVIFVTLVLQGLSLPLLVRLLGVEPQDNTQQEERELQLKLANEVLCFIEQDFPIELSPNLHRMLIRRYELLVTELTRALEATPAIKPVAEESTFPLSQLMAAQLAISNFQQGLIVKMYREGEFSDEALRAAEQSLDLEKARLDALQLITRE
ncbi:Na+/H+ antiporter [Spirosoma knui]